ncbi:FAD binding domain-containing protein [Robertmurraya massiliosenegalensis]|uniref:FAD binding domain-containing protein n=1 Tax=Robertmurraya massiliosenegalensis TaxID=1287657 RepID=UPI000303FFA5|nr:xanthine dehydrogenase family protein subunit M [Robertmurraya massiliosenegalensis]
MKAVEFEYFRASTLDDAINLLDSYQEDAKILNGGQSLLPVLNMRLARPKYVIDINEITALGNITIENDVLKIGAVVRHNTAETSELIKEKVPLLAQALPHVGHTQIRNRGTLVGSIVHADPSAEVPLIALLLDAYLEVTSKESERIIPITEFYFGYMLTDLQPYELVTSVNFPLRKLPSGGNRGTAFVEVARREGDFAIVEAACQMDINAEGKIAEVRLGIGGVGPAPLRLVEVEAFLNGKEPSSALFKEASQKITEFLEPDEDPFVPQEYRVEVAKRFTYKVLEDASVDAALEKGARQE